jgi:hypothetical protein
MGAIARGPFLVEDKEHGNIRVFNELGCSSGDVTVMVDGKPIKLETLEDVIAWASFHDATISAWWNEQRRFNSESGTKTSECQRFMHAEIKEIRKDISAIRRLIYIAMGGVLVMGGVASLVASHFFNSGGMH